METQSTQLGFLDMLSLLFIGLKLTGHIDWNWFWILLPVIVPAVLGLVILWIKGR